MSETIELKLKVIQGEPLEGSAHWILANAAAMRVIGRPWQAVCLLDKKGEVIDYLVYRNSPAERLFTPDRTVRVENAPWGVRRAYTDEGWGLMSKLSLKARELMADVPARTVNILLVGKDPVADVLMREAKDDPAARAALIDYLNNGGD